MAAGAGAAGQWGSKSKPRLARFRCPASGSGDGSGDGVVAAATAAAAAAGEMPQVGAAPPHLLPYSVHTVRSWLVLYLVVFSVRFL
jgi:hypothetical protein